MVKKNKRMKPIDPKIWRERMRGMGGGGHVPPQYSDIDFSDLDLGGIEDKKKEKKKSTSTFTDHRHCTVCGEKFDSMKRGITRVPRSDRKTIFAFCSKECTEIYDRGFIQCV